MEPARQGKPGHPLPVGHMLLAEFSEVGSEEEEKIKEIYKELGLQVLAVSQKS